MGTFGDVTTLSFFANKIITTGEGGAVLTNNKKTYLKMFKMRDHGMKYNQKYNHKRMGYNYRMTNLQAAIGCSQVDELKQIQKENDTNETLLSLSKRYRRNNDKKFPKLVFSCALDVNNYIKKNLRQKFLKHLQQNKIDARQMVNPINDALHIKKIIRVPKCSKHIIQFCSLTKWQ